MDDLYTDIAAVRSAAKKLTQQLDVQLEDARFRYIAQAIVRNACELEVANEIELWKIRQQAVR